MVDKNATLFHTAERTRLARRDFPYVVVADTGKDDFRIGRGCGRRWRV
jgi:hypothetical protein